MRKLYAVKIRINGDVKIIPFPMDEPELLKWMQKHVGGYIEVTENIALSNYDAVMIMNEEGKLKCLPVNDLATAIYDFGDSDEIVGDVLILLRDGEELTGMSMEQAAVMVDEIQANG